MSTTMNPNLSPSAIDVIDALAKRGGDSVAQDAIRTIIELSNELASARAETIQTLMAANDALNEKLAVEKGLVHYYRTLVQLSASPPHDLSAKMKILTDGCDIISRLRREKRKLYKDAGGE